ncbi:hypothetical protein P280DRAFT_522382 [Massarina eburnea CBS 473.64]|uniref:Uncharacterized protein n=1 Tax=Massarina eburnea CBS 473.64 TaxID=1395130 RepID=A0A6A6RNP5_9PLEO|nr:hypothetical protein P280DRAFT_522382 [Massarina eburnea CBS 473.64]
MEILPPPGTPPPFRATKDPGTHGDPPIPGVNIPWPSMIGQLITTMPTPSATVLSNTSPQSSPACTPSTYTSILDVSTWTNTFTYTTCVSGSNSYETAWTSQTCSNFRTESYTREVGGTDDAIVSSFVFCATNTAPATAFSTSDISTLSTSSTSSAPSTASSISQASDSTTTLIREPTVAPSVPNPALDYKEKSNTLAIALPVTFLFIALAAIIYAWNRHRRHRLRKAEESSNGSITTDMVYSPRVEDGGRSYSTVIAGGDSMGSRIGGRGKWTSGGHRDYSDGVPRPPPRVKSVGMYPPMSPYGPI